jgi:hypothetical protein
MNSRISPVKYIASLGMLLATALPLFAEPADGNAQIRAATNDSTIVITTTRRLAGAIDSLKWNGHEFINSADHGRQLQSACSFDNTRDAGAETFNPTEAGSRRDGAGANSTSRLLEITASGNHLRTRTQMAFWLAPGERSEGQLARNTNTLSDYVLTKDVTIGYGSWPQALDYRVTFSVPVGAQHVSAQFEALTGYLPPEFSRFLEFNPATGKLQPLSDGPGEIKNPVVLATPDGNFAIGIFAPPQQQPETRGPSFGRWKFDWAHVVKWNCVYRVQNPQGIRDGDYSYRMLVPIGTLAQVEAMLRDWRELRW